ncbi:MAG: DUF5362 family protein [Calditrichia bacterium]
MEEVIVQETGPEAGVLQQIINISSSMTGWLKFLGIMNIIFGAIQAISVVGILIAWIPIWLGVLLLQAGNRITNARLSNNNAQLVEMVDKLRLYFIIQGILYIVMLAMMVVGFIFFGAFFSKMLEQYSY